MNWRAFLRQKYCCDLAEAVSGIGGRVIGLAILLLKLAELRRRQNAAAFLFKLRFQLGGLDRAGSLVVSVLLVDAVHTGQPSTVQG